jgi:hypothetical protein
MQHPMPEHLQARLKQLGENAERLCDTARQIGRQIVEELKRRPKSNLLSEIQALLPETTEEEFDYLVELGNGREDVDLVRLMRLWLPLFDLHRN